MIATKNFKETKDGRFRLNLTDDIKRILIGAAQHYVMICMKPYEFFLAMELVEALEKPQVKLRRSEFFLLFSHPLIKVIPEETQNYISAYLDVDEIKRQHSSRYQYHP